ncbi:MAG: shikimate dehydrogenase [Planctomycetes bacterium]|nr:shikimate dehydrogenase [Planctomycetota bacterium]
MTYLTVPIAAIDFDQAAKQIKSAITAGAEMLEIRADYLRNLSVELVEKIIVKAKKASKTPLPLIVTCRDKQQGGSIAYPIQLRLNILTAALNAGAEFIDFEYENFLTPQSKEKIQLALSHNPSARLILSAHNFEGKFDNIIKLHRHIQTVYSVAIPKLVYKANHINDCFDALDLLHKTGGERIIFCMGEAGLVSRIIAKKLDSFVTFAITDEKTATAPGQITIEKFKKLYRYDSINSDTKLHGTIASPVAHSLSPAIHNACFTKAKENRLYLPLLVDGGKDEFDLFLQNITRRPWLNFSSFSVTLPHKQNAISYVKEKNGFVEPLTEKIGASNTLLLDTDGNLSAYNTDYSGALDAIIDTLDNGLDELKDLPTAILGAGGAARALVAGLTNAGAKVKIYNRTVEKAEELAAKFDCQYAGLDDLPNLDAKLLINCTSIGMSPNVNATPIPQKYLKSTMTVFDTIYTPTETLLLKQAKKKKAKTINGIAMFVNQAATQFKLYTGKNADTKLMRKTVSDCLAAKQTV